MLQTVFFYAFSIVLVLSALQVVLAKNPVQSVLFLVLAFVTSSCLWIMLNVEFLALTLILVYVGAVMVLFLFVVMMLDIDIETMRKGFWKNLPLAICLGLVILVEMIMVLVTKPVVVYKMSQTDGTLSNSNQIGWVLYTQYSYPVELASLILLLGLVVAVALTLRSSEKNSKYQDISKQVAVSSLGRIEMVKMQAEKPEIEGE
ncbi:MAG: NADH-quinone oxidoreductase subunit [Burkholderiales bacterium]|jgi:NADH-quinone oxidoreductase subunit J|nr:NADH-quinone oxidoreductase subunit [Burkholderiales bacterium]